MAELEIDLEEAKKLAKSGSEIMVLIDNFGDVELVKEILEAKDNVEEIDFGEARVIVMSLGEPKDLSDLAKKYENAVIVCPHGNTSLRMANALKQIGVHAYSLRGGIAGLRAR